RVLAECWVLKRASPSSSLTQWDILTLIIQHIFHLNRGGSDVQNTIPTIDDVALMGHKHIFSLRQKNAFRLAGAVRITEKLQINGRRRGGRRRSVDLGLLPIYRWV